MQEVLESVVPSTYDIAKHDKPDIYVINIDFYCNLTTCTHELCFWNQRFVFKAPINSVCIDIIRRKKSSHGYPHPLVGTVCHGNDNRLQFPTLL